MTGSGRSAEETDLRAFSLDSNSHAVRREQIVGPRASSNAYEASVKRPPICVPNPDCASTLYHHFTYWRVQNKERATPPRCRGKASGSRDGIGVTALRLVSGKRDIVDIH